ncbi:MAG: ester cyclase [Candidatus Hodarchaeota archaeon]
MKNNFLNFVILILVLLLLQGCGKKNTVDLMKVAEQFQQIFNSHDARAVAQTYAEDATYMVSGEPEPLRGRKAIEENYRSFFRAFPDVEVEFTLIAVSGDHFMAEGVTRGTHTGPLATPEGDIQPTNRKIEFQFAFIAKVTPEGLIAEDRTYYDPVSFMNQLGLNEQPE